MPNSEEPEIASLTPEQLPATLTTAEMTLSYAQNATAESTRIAYDGDMASFRQWCEARGASPLPAAPAMVAAYLAHLADIGRKASGIGRAAAGIAYHHRQTGIDPSPTAHEGVKRTMRGIRRRLGSAKQGKAPIVADMLAAMLKHCPDTLAGKRDAALIHLPMLMHGYATERHHIVEIGALVERASATFGVSLCASAPNRRCTR